MFIYFSLLKSDGAFVSCFSFYLQHVFLPADKNKKKAINYLLTILFFVRSRQWNIDIYFNYFSELERKLRANNREYNLSFKYAVSMKGIFFILLSNLSRREEEEVLHHIKENNTHEHVISLHYVTLSCNQEALSRSTFQELARLAGFDSGLAVKPSLTSCLQSFSLRQTPSKPPSTTSSPSYLSTCLSSFRGSPTPTSCSCWSSR